MPVEVFRTRLCDLRREVALSKGQSGFLVCPVGDSNENPAVYELQPQQVQEGICEWHSLKNDAIHSGINRRKEMIKMAHNVFVMIDNQRLKRGLPDSFWRIAPLWKASFRGEVG